MHNGLTLMKILTLLTMLTDGYLIMLRKAKHTDCTITHVQIVVVRFKHQQWEDNMNEFDEWDQAWNLTESGLALIDAIEKAKQDAEL